MATREFFFDTSFAVALSVVGDQHHEAATAIARMLVPGEARLVTTRAVVLEIGNALARTRYRAGLIRLLADMEADPDLEIIPLSEELFARGAALLKERGDKEWGLTDCISFEVMRDRGIVDALTADAHFRQAGFRPLLVRR